MEISQLKTLTVDELLQDRVKASFLQRVQDLMRWQDQGMAYQYLRALEKHSNGREDIQKAYRDMIVDLQWTAFALLTEAECVGIARRNLLAGMKEEHDSVLALRQILIYKTEEEEEYFKRALSRAMETNEELFGTRTISQWLAEYRTEVSSKSYEEISLARSTYFGTNMHIRSLDAPSRAVFERLIHLYEFVNTASLVPAGYAGEMVFTWPDNGISMLFDGEIHKVYVPPSSEQPVSERKPSMQPSGIEGFSSSSAMAPASQRVSVSAPPLPAVVVQKLIDAQDAQMTVHGTPLLKKDLAQKREALRKAFIGPLEEQSAIQTEEQQMQNMNPSDLVSLCVESARQKNVFRAIAALYTLADQGVLQEEFYGRDALRKNFTVFLEHKKGKSAASDFDKNGFMHPHLLVFLKAFLMGKLGLSEASSARVGIQIESRLVKNGKMKPGDLAYGDLAAGEYRWKE